MNLRLRTPMFRRSRVTGIRCRLCGQWRKPRHIRVPAMVCRDCETTPAFQYWKPTTKPSAPATSSAIATGGGRS
jgi:hypothetical protein